MSRRKQGRPQQRKTLDPLEQDNDLLVCGGCQTNFPLQDILKFIKHKVNRCNKENVDLLDPTDYEDGEEPESEAVSISSKRTSISAPITRKDLLDNKISPRPSVESIDSLKEVDIKEDNVASPEERLFENRVARSPLKSKQVADAESNTICTEPSQFQCETCKSLFSSAWTLLQHAQKEHGMKIYTDYNDSCATPPKQKKPSDPPRKGSPNERPSSFHHSQSPHHPQTHRSHHHHHLYHQRDRHESILEQKEKDRDPPGIQHLPQELHRTPSTASSVGSAESGHCRQSPQHPFTGAFRFPFDRPPLSPSLPFPRIPGNDYHPITSESLHIGRTGIMGFPPHIFEPGRSYPPLPFDRPRPPPGLDGHHLNQLDSFYSQRLKELAKGPLSPARRQTPPFSQTGTAIPFPSITPPNAQLSAEPNKENDSGSLTPPSKLKSCEFCGKSFRFQSNLIVHRRSHTGEKPFKCPLCPHACTQQSKLKRHMKTHMKSPLCNIPNASEGSMASGSSTPDSGKVFGDKEDDNEEEEEFEEEDEEMEEEEDFEDREDLMEDGDTNDTHLKKESIEVRSENKTSVLAAKLLEPPSTDQLRSTDSKLQESSHLSKSSFLSEVMKNSGLTSLPVYNEAFKQALEENIKNETASPSNENKEISENGSSLSNSNSNDGTKEDGRNTATSRQSSDSDQDSVKRVKREPDTPFHSTGGMDSLYPLWGFQHPQIDFYHNIPSVFHSRFDPDPNHNGFNTTNHDSALKSLNTQGVLPVKPGPSSSSDTNGLPSTPRRDKRNDTCEYCGKIFKNCSNLTVHRRSHTGEKPYKCELCSYACAQSSKLTRHMKTHGRIGKDVYRCKFCSMPFSVASTLEKHMRKCMDTRQGRILQDADSDTNSTTASNA